MEGSDNRAVGEADGDEDSRASKGSFVGNEERLDQLIEEAGLAEHDDDACSTPSDYEAGTARSVPRVELMPDSRIRSLFSSYPFGKPHLGMGGEYFTQDEWWLERAECTEALSMLQKYYPGPGRKELLDEPRKTGKGALDDKEFRELLDLYAKIGIALPGENPHRADMSAVLHHMQGHFRPLDTTRENIVYEIVTTVREIVFWEQVDPVLKTSIRDIEDVKRVCEKDNEVGVLVRLGHVIVEDEDGDMKKRAVLESQEERDAIDSLKDDNAFQSSGLADVLAKSDAARRKHLAQLCIILEGHESVKDHAMPVVLLDALLRVERITSGCFERGYRSLKHVISRERKERQTETELRDLLMINQQRLGLLSASVMDSRTDTTGLDNNLQCLSEIVVSLGEQQNVVLEALERIEKQQKKVSVSSMGNGASVGAGPNYGYAFNSVSAGATGPSVFPTPSAYPFPSSPATPPSASMAGANVMDGTGATVPQIPPRPARLFTAGGPYPQQSSSSGVMVAPETSQFSQQSMFPVVVDEDAIAYQSLHLGIDIQTTAGQVSIIIHGMQNAWILEKKSKQRIQFHQKGIDYLRTNCAEDMVRAQTTGGMEAYFRMIDKQKGINSSNKDRITAIRTLISDEEKTMKSHTKTYVDKGQQNSAGGVAGDVPKEKKFQPVQTEITEWTNWLNKSDGELGGTGDKKTIERIIDFGVRVALSRSGPNVLPFLIKAIRTVDYDQGSLFPSFAFLYPDAEGFVYLGQSRFGPYDRNFIAYLREQDSELHDRLYARLNNAYGPKGKSDLLSELIESTMCKFEDAHIGLALRQRKSGLKLLQMLATTATRKSLVGVRSAGENFYTIMKAFKHGDGKTLITQLQTIKETLKSCTQITTLSGPKLKEVANIFYERLNRGGCSAPDYLRSNAIGVSGHQPISGLPDFTSMLDSYFSTMRGRGETKFKKMQEVEACKRSGRAVWDDTDDGVDPEWRTVCKANAYPLVPHFIDVISEITKLFKDMFEGTYNENMKETDRSKLSSEEQKVLDEAHEVLRTTYGTKGLKSSAKKKKPKNGKSDRALQATDSSKTSGKKTPIPNVGKRGGPLPKKWWPKEGACQGLVPLTIQSTDASGNTVYSKYIEKACEGTVSNREKSRGRALCDRCLTIAEGQTRNTRKLRDSKAKPKSSYMCYAVENEDNWTAKQTRSVDFIKGKAYLNKEFLKLCGRKPESYRLPNQAQESARRANNNNSDDDFSEVELDDDLSDGGESVSTHHTRNSKSSRKSRRPKSTSESLDDDIAREVREVKKLRLLDKLKKERAALERSVSEPEQDEDTGSTFSGSDDGRARLARDSDIPRGRLGGRGGTRGGSSTRGRRTVRGGRHSHLGRGAGTQIMNDANRTPSGHSSSGSHYSIPVRGREERND